MTETKRVYSYAVPALEHPDAKNEPAKVVEQTHTHTHSRSLSLHWFSRGYPQNRGSWKEGRTLPSTPRLAVQIPNPSLTADRFDPELGPWNPKPWAHQGAKSERNPPTRSEGSQRLRVPSLDVFRAKSQRATGLASYPCGTPQGQNFCGGPR